MVSLGLGILLSPLLVALVNLLIETPELALVSIGAFLWILIGGGLLTWGLVHWDE